MGEHINTTVLETEHIDKPGMATPDNEHLEKSVTEDNLIYDDIEEEPELHMRTYVALASMFLLNLVQVFALQGPPAVVSPSLTVYDLADQASFLTSEQALTTLRRKPGSRTRSLLYRQSSHHLYPLLRIRFRLESCSSSDHVSSPSLEQPLHLAQAPSTDS